MTGGTDPPAGLLEAFAAVQQALFEHVLQPLLFQAGLGNLLEDGYAATGWLLVGVLQIGVMITLLRALERRRPVEPVLDRAAVRTDMVYTLVHRLGLFRLALFFTVDPLWNTLVGKLRVAGLPAYSLDALWPGVTDLALVSFALYLVLFDFVDYWIHRGQHRLHAWWQLHALHHSQRQMTLWSDPRNHLLDDLIRDSILVLVGLLAGVAPSQFVAIVACTHLLESLSHANVRLRWPAPLSRCLVSPQFHRLHHAVGYEHVGGARGPGGANFAVLFPWWDVLFGTARFDDVYAPTGLRDQAEGRDYGRGFWSQQWLGLKRLAGRA